MNDRNNMDSTGTVNSDDVLVADETNVKGGRGSVCHGQFNCGRYFRPLIVYFCIAMALVFSVMGFVDLKVNAAEITYSIDNVVNSQFANFPYRFIARSGDNYMIFYSDSKIYYTSSTRYVCNGGSGTCGYTSLMIENNVLVANPSGNSSTFNLSNGKVEINVFGYSEVIWSSYDVPIGNLSNGSYIQTGIHFDTSNNAVYVPDTSDDAESGVADNTTECKFNDENIVASIEKLDSDLVAKIDIVIMLLVMMIALKMFSPLANNHKKGLDKKEK